MKNNLVGLSVGIVCAIVMIGTVLMPTIDEIQLTSGDAITYSNPLDDYNVYMREIQDGDVLTIVADGTSATSISLNGTAISTISGDSTIPYHSLIFSDVFNVWSSSATGYPQFAVSGATSISYLSGAATTTISYSDGGYSLEWVPESGTDYSTSVSGGSWGYIVCNEDEAEYYESVRTGGTAFYVSNANDVVCSGVYTTGELDTYYWYYNGESGCNDGYTATTDVGMTLVDGTTDIYSATVSIEITDGTDTEEFTPYRIMIPLEVSGHATSGTLYTLWAIIPLFTILAVLCLVTYAVMRNRD